MLARKMDVQKFLEPTVNVERIAEILDGLGHEGRYHTLRTWSKKEMARIFDAVKGHKPVDLDFFCPTTEPLVEVIHDLHNAMGLPGYTQKRFCKVAEDDTTLAGWNATSTNVFTGPGYYTATKGDGEYAGELVVDYTKLPKAKDPRWPPIQENGGLIGGIVYGGMIDYVRGISNHVSIGKAYKGGKPRGFYFAMVRRDPT